MIPRLEKQPACTPLIASGQRRPFCFDAELYAQHLPPDQADQ